MTKRLFDLTFAICGVLLLLPLLALISALIKIEDGGPVFYRGVRTGQHARRFRIVKFRTMVINAEKLGASSTADDDARITRVGQFLRRYKLDELPQLINVVKGEMSLVGPRPQVQWAVDLYTMEERGLLSVRPGITDYASLVFRDEGAILRGSTNPDKDYLEKIHPEKVRLGLVYVSRSCLLIDIQIIVATLGAVFGLQPKWCLPASDVTPQERRQRAFPT